MRQRVKMAVLFSFMVFIFLVGCQKKQEVTDEKPIIKAEIKDTPLPSVEPEEGKDDKSEEQKGKERSLLTGLWVDKKIANQRPIAMMINNIAIASPQSGISEASILYEAVVEGGITRMLALFETVKGDRIGSVRSARHYFVSFADEYDAIYAHYGQTKYAINKIRELSVDTISGQEAVASSTAYFRDNSIKAPHNAFAKAKGLYEVIEKKGYRTKLRDGMANHFTFYEEDTKLKDGQAAGKKVTLGYSGYTSPYFTYDDKKEVYLRYQFNKPHIDKASGEQLAFKNIILQYVPYRTIDQKNGYQTMDIENGKGEGLYITNGKAVPITWDKNEKKKEMHYYDEKGNLLTINPGKTYIGLYPVSRLKALILE